MLINLVSLNGYMNQVLGAARVMVLVHSLTPDHQATFTYLWKLMVKC